MNKFDSIRPYHDNEVNSVLIKLTNNRRFLKMLLETGEYKNVDTMVGVLDKLFTSGKVKMVLDPRKTQAFERGATAAQLFFQLIVGNTPISDITLRYKGNFRAAPNFLATPTKEFKNLLKR